MCRVPNSAAQPRVCKATPTRAAPCPGSSGMGRMSPALNELLRSLLCQSLVHLCNISSGFWLSTTNSQSLISTHPALSPRSSGASPQRRSVRAAAEARPRSDALLSLLPGSLLKSVGHVLWPDHQGYFSLLLGSCKNETQL